MKRRKMKASKSKRLFRKTASRFHKINATSTVKRGGIRL